MERPLILVTNDDGIHSKGLWAAAAAVDELGEVLVVAPEEHQSSTGRSMPKSSLGRIQRVESRYEERILEGYAVHGSPAQVVQHALLEIAPRRIDLLVAGINYGENVGVSVTISGTVGAALEAASFGIPSLAVSLQLSLDEVREQPQHVDFSAAAHFVCKFATRLLRGDMPHDVDVLKVEVPREATPTTPWRMTHLSRVRYYLPRKPDRKRLEDAMTIGYAITDGEGLEPESDGKALLDGFVAVTPLSLDMTSRVDLEAFRSLLDEG